MYVKQLGLKNWRVYESATLDCAPLTVIRGANHSGKSSVAHAFQLGLGSYAEGTDKKGAGAGDKIKVGEDQAEILMRLAGANSEIDYRVRYGKSGRSDSARTVGVDPKDGDPGAKMFTGWLAAQRDRIRCILDSSFFVSQNGEQKNILASLILPTKGTCDPEMNALVEKHFGEIDWEGKPLVQTIDQVYELAFGERTKAKATLQGIHIPPTPIAMAYTVEEVQGRLTELRSKLSKETKKRPAADNTKAIAILKASIAELEKKVKTADDELQILHPALWDHESNIIGKDKLQIHAKTAAKRNLWNQLLEKEAEALREAESQVEVQQIFRDMLSEPKCPTCKQVISEEFINERVEEHKRQENDARAMHTNLMRERAELGDVEMAEKLIAANEAAVTAKTQIQREIATHNSAKANAQAELSLKRKDLESMEQQEPAPAADQPNPAVDSLNAEISTWEGHLRSAITYEATIKQIDEATIRRAAQQEKVAELERLVAFFGKDGWKAKLIEQNVASFLEVVNSVLAYWGYACNLQFEPYAFSVTNSDGRTLPTKELSGSEQLMFGIALQCAIAVYSKIRFVLIDKADTLLDRERGRLFSALNALVTNGTLQQAIVMVSDAREEAPQGNPNVAFYMAGGGNLRRLN